MFSSLSSLLFLAVCAYAGAALRGSAEVTAGDCPVFAAPDDFIEPVRFIGNDGLERPFFSWKYLHDRYPDFRSPFRRCI